MDRKPWDERLLDWMSRGSAPGDRDRQRWGAKARTVYAAWLLPFFGVRLAGGSGYVALAAGIGAGAAVEIGWRVIERRRGRSAR